MRRRDYWLKGVLVLSPFNLLLGSVAERFTGLMYWVLVIAGVTGGYAFAALVVKRLHDRDRSGWFVVVPLITVLLQGVVQALADVLHEDLLPDSFVGAVPAFLFFAVAALIWSASILIPVHFLKGTHGPNRFGEDPLDEGMHSRQRNPIPKNS